MRLGLRRGSRRAHNYLRLRWRLIVTKEGRWRGMWRVGLGELVIYDPTGL